MRELDIGKMPLKVYTKMTTATIIVAKCNKSSRFFLIFFKVSKPIPAH
jgi:hypothetical protein